MGEAQVAQRQRCVIRKYHPTYEQTIDLYSGPAVEETRQEGWWPTERSEALQ